MSKQVEVRNTNSYPVPVKIRHADGTLDSIHLQARGRATLREGCTVDANWKAAEGQGIVINMPTPTIPKQAFEEIE